MPHLIDYSLYLVISQSDCLGRDVFQVLEQAVSGGVSLVQLREKTMPTRDLVALAKRMKAFLDQHNIPLIINDRVGVALAVDADGVHVGQEDMHPLDVRPLIGAHRILGLSINTQDQLSEARTLPVDYLGIGPIFSTQTKKDCKPVLGLQGLSAMCRKARMPVVGIGGIKQENAKQVIDARADGIAVVSAICGAQSPQEAAAELRHLITR
ncbi:MAG: thiamine phosphate synthase [Desulfovermiculus sp.]|nr:thiamine phosphate synthase [Desulfovermiculus sp.]